MPLPESLHLSSSVAAAVERLGWDADQALLREAAATAARGHNLVMVVPSFLGRCSSLFTQLQRPRRHPAQPLSQMAPAFSDAAFALRLLAACLGGPSL